MRSLVRSTAGFVNSSRGGTERLDALAEQTPATALFMGPFRL